MKKIINMLAFLAAVISFTACNDTQNILYEESSERILEVVSADVTFGPDASSGTIVVNSDKAISASSNADWCTVSVSGKTVTVNVTGYSEIDSRNALVTVTDGYAKALVPVHQNGKLVNLVAEKSYVFEKSGSAPVTIVDKSNCNVTVTTSDNWITVTETPDGYVITVSDNSGEYRKGTVTFSAGDITKTVYVGQFGEIEPVLEGNYTAYWDEYDDAGVDLESWYMPGVTISKGTVADTYTIANLAMLNEANNWPLTLYYTASTNDYYIQSGWSPGKFQSYTLRCVMNYKSATATSYSTSTTVNTAATNTYRMSFAWDIDDEANLCFKFVKNPTMAASATYKTYDVPGFQICVYNSTTSASATYRQGYLFMFWNLKLVKD